MISITTNLHDWLKRVDLSSVFAGLRILYKYNENKKSKHTTTFGWRLLETGQSLKARFQKTEDQVSLFYITSGLFVAISHTEDNIC